MRRRRPLLRAAAVGGTAYVAGKHRAQRAQEQQSAEAEQNQRLADLEQQTASQQQAPQQAPQQQAPQVSAQGQASMLDQLKQLDTLHSQGSLTDEEFAAAKAKLLSG